VIACLLTAAIGFVLMPLVFAVTNRVLPPRNTMTWWQWWKAINFLPKAMAVAVICAVASAATFASGDWRWGTGFAGAAVGFALWGLLYLRLLQRRTGQR
jgi:hypothetical protein